MPKHWLGICATPQGNVDMQKFQGEDLTAGNRSSAQKAQCKEWWHEQALAKAATLAQEKASRAASDAFVIHCDETQRKARKDEVTARQLGNAELLKENNRLAAARRAAAAADADWEKLMATHEMESTMGSMVLAEDPRQGASAVSPLRVRKDHWKGMTPTEKQAILDEQFRQVWTPFCGFICSKAHA
jgi:hypothetical protein